MTAKPKPKIGKRIRQSSCLVVPNYKWEKFLQPASISSTSIRVRKNSALRPASIRTLGEPSLARRPVDMLQAQVDILCAMEQPRIFFKTQRLAMIAVVGSLALFAGNFYLYGQDKSEFPDGYDAVQAAPNSHKVVFENTFVRVLEVTVPTVGSTEPMH